MNAQNNPWHKESRTQNLKFQVAKGWGKTIKAGLLTVAAVGATLTFIVHFSLTLTLALLSATEPVFAGLMMSYEKLISTICNIVI